ncbi:heterokaryon incompatibility protein-domain-containing protein [Xylogone sp. PMI_703]|nr:heterokaryon incompatibility protein-domain-containing protein [Xylogone sp. PMI_703]
MRLLNVKTRLLEEFFEDSIPRYAILSHTWQANEVTFQDLQSSPKLSSRSTKLEGCCRQAAKDRYGYVWIDTCCIDKSSSAELSEAINSMFSWYEGSDVCYVYLADVSAGQEPSLPESNFRRSRWFRRGWTLQELLAPSHLNFYDKSWGLIGHVTKFPLTYGPGPDLSDLISEIADIPDKFVAGEADLDRTSIAQRMSWASRRETTRVEDEAYCLLGIFGVNMPLLYGEGRRAFTRLQEEILKASDDQSIFSWDYGLTKITNAALPPGLPREALVTEVFATGVADFRKCGKIREYEIFQSSHYSITNKGLLIEPPLLELESGDFLGFKFYMICPYKYAS